MKILALDLSLTATGYADSDGNSGVLRPPPGWTGMQRLKWILDNVWARAEHVDLVAIEGFAFGAQGRAILDLAGLGTLVRFTLWEADKPIADIPPASLKLFACGKGNAKKDEMFAEAIRRLGYTGTDHNEADALWLLAMTRAKYDHESLTDAKERAISKIDWPALQESAVP